MLNRNPVGKRFKAIRPNCQRNGMVGECFSWEQSRKPEDDWLRVRFGDGIEQMRKRKEYEEIG